MMRRMGQRSSSANWAAAAVLAVVVSLMALRGGAAADPPLLTPPTAGSGELPPAPWHVVGLPAQSKPFTRFGVVTLDGQRVLRIEAQSSYGNLVHALEVDRGNHRLSWRWRLEQGLPQADLRRRDGDDSSLKVCALFDLPTSAVPFVERQMLRVMRLRSTEPLPAASICYVWDAHLAPGTVLDNAYTRRIRLLVLRGPEAPLHGWVAEQRDVWADFQKLFGDEALAVPPLVGIAVGADADNTQSRSLGYLADLDLQ